VVQSEGRIKVVVGAAIMGSDLSPVRAFEPAIEVVDANAAFEAYNRAARANDAAAKQQARDELAAKLADADVFCMAFPALTEIVALAPKLRWLHHTQAGVSNLWPTDVWNAEGVLITSGRGHVRTTAMAEYTVAGALHFARGIYGAHLDKPEGRLDRANYPMLRIEGATMGVVGLGGIGKEIARLSKALGMRVVATRRSVTQREENVDHADVVLPASELVAMAAECDFLAVAAQLTDETQHMVNADVFAAMKPSAVVINIARGEVIDEDALIAALNDGKLRGAVLDVYEGEMSGKPPRPELFEAPGLLLTPHISNGGAVAGNEFMDLFVENLGRYVRGEELLNVVDRQRGY
jgi:phosphoglycerate dehydrogenase-like enzyme